MQHITWPRGVICHSFESMLFLSFLSLHLPLFTSPPFTSIFLPPFLSPFCTSSLPTDPTIASNGSAPISASVLSAKITGNRTSKWRCIPGSWKGMPKAKRAGLEGTEDWDMQEGLQAGKTWGTSIDTGKELTHRSSWWNHLQHFYLEWLVQEKMYFTVIRIKINRSVSALRCWIFDLIWNECVCTSVRTSLLLFYYAELLWNFPSHFV